MRANDAPARSDGALRGRMDQRETVHLDDLEWQDSPGHEVQRKRLHRVGPAESGQVTSLVRYPAGSNFPAHDHPEGEEIFVLEGIFSDQQGNFPAGTHLLNPEGFRHSPGSEPGCLLFVKLRQYAGVQREHRVTPTAGVTFEASSDAGIETLVLDDAIDFPDATRLERWSKGTQEFERRYAGGAEIFVYEGTLHDDAGIHSSPSWLRFPAGTLHRAGSEGGCRIYLKTGAVAALRSELDG